MRTTKHVWFGGRKNFKGRLLLLLMMYKSRECSSHKPDAKKAVCSIKAINTDKEWHKHTHTRTRLHSEKHKSIVRATPVQHLFHMRIDYVNEWLVGLFFLFDSEIVSSVRVLSICSPSDAFLRFAVCESVVVEVAWRHIIVWVKSGTRLYHRKQIVLWKSLIFLCLTYSRNYVNE